MYWNMFKTFSDLLVRGEICESIPTPGVVGALEDVFKNQMTQTPSTNQNKIKDQEFTKSR